MEYYKILLNNNKCVYGMQEYFPYTDKPFFNAIDKILIDKEYKSSIANYIAEMYTDEILFESEFNNASVFNYIVPVKYKSEKFTRLNFELCIEIARLLNIKVLDNYFQKINFDSVDIRDEYTKNKAKEDIEFSVGDEDILNDEYIKNIIRDEDEFVVINELYKNTPVIIFDFCCSTGFVFKKISSKTYNNMYLCYGIRHAAEKLNNTNISKISIVGFDEKLYDEKYEGYIVRIYGLFKEKDVEIDFRNKITLYIGENGFGKTTAMKIAVLAIKDLEYNDFSNLSKFYFNHIDIFKQKLVDKSLCLDEENDSIDLEENNQIITFKKTIDYSTTLPTKDNLVEYIEIEEFSSGFLNNEIDNTIDFLKIIEEEEYLLLIRKIINQDVSRNIDYLSFASKYKETTNLDDVDKVLVNYFSNQKDLQTNSIETETIFYFDCAKSRMLANKFRRDGISLYSNGNFEYDSPFENDEVDFEFVDYIDDLDEDDYPYDYDPKDMDDYDEYNPYEDNYGSKEVDYDDNKEYNPEKDPEIRERKHVYIKLLNYFGDLNTNDINYKNVFYNDVEKLYVNNKKQEIFIKGENDKTYSTDKDIFDRKTISVHSILIKLCQNETINYRDYYHTGGIKTKFYSTLKMLFDYYNKNYDAKILMYAYEDRGFTQNLYLSTKLLFQSKKNINKIKKMYDDIFNKDIDVIYYGIYEIIDKDDFKLLKEIVDILKINKIKTENDCIAVIGIHVLIDIFKKDFINSDLIKLEKLLNKYLVNKHAKVFPYFLAIFNNQNELIPLNLLSTGEKNLIIILSICAYYNLYGHEHKTIVLDEPDLSMSLEWQAKLLPDILKYYHNRYVIISQSPLLIHKNNLDSFVKRMDFSDEVDNLVITSDNDDNFNQPVGDIGDDDLLI